MKLEASKSLLLRYLIIQSYARETLQIIGDSSCDDVIKMKEALNDFPKNKKLDCGSAGAVLRFLTLRCSREAGEFQLTGTKRLLERPNAPLFQILGQLGVNGWQEPSSPIHIDCHESSQFASALLLNAWELPFPLRFELSEARVSDGYWRMTLFCVRECGMEVLEGTNNDYLVPANQKVRVHSVVVESDASSAFALACVAAVSGEVKIPDFPKNSLQPDAIFPEILKAMNVPIAWENGNNLVVGKSKELRPISINLQNTPDLYPGLAVLAFFAKGKSQFDGIGHLAGKESNRIAKVAELLERMKQGAPFVFDPAEDHRLAMAAAVAKAGGIPVTILHPEVVAKSFPNFWECLQKIASLIFYPV